MYLRNAPSIRGAVNGTTRDVGEAFRNHLVEKMIPKVQRSRIKRFAILGSEKGFPILGAPRKRYTGKRHSKMGQFENLHSTAINFMRDNCKAPYSTKKGYVGNLYKLTIDFTLSQLCVSAHKIFGAQCR